MHRSVEKSDLKVEDCPFLRKQFMLTSVERG